MAGDEFYIREWPQLEGRTFAEVLVSFEDAIPLGVRRPDGALMINPLDSYRLRPGAPAQGSPATCCWRFAAQRSRPPPRMLGPLAGQPLPADGCVR